MNTRTITILAAMGVAVLASPVVAQSSTQSGRHAGISSAHGSVSSRSGREMTRAGAEERHVRVRDCLPSEYVHQDQAGNWHCD
jgi:hypothetical protein